jgi:hypothetical protein
VGTRALGAAALIAVLLPAAPAFAADGPDPQCRAAMAQQWPELVRSPRPGNPPSISLPIPGARSEDASPAAATAANAPPARREDPLGGALQTLASTCAADRTALADILILQAQRARFNAEPRRALDLLARVDLKPGDRSYALLQAERLKALTETGGLGAALPGVLDTHEQALAAAGFTPQRRFTVAGIAFRAYAHTERAKGWLLVGLRPNGEIETLRAGIPDWAQGRAFESDTPPFDVSNTRCSESGQYFEDGNADFDESVTLDSVVAILEANFANPERDGNRNGRPGIPDFCPNLKDMLPGFGPVLEFLGTEYRETGAGYAEFDLALALQSEDAAERHAAADYLADHPDAADPMNLIYAVTSLVERGDMERATFWYYIWQTRTRAWMAADSNVAQLRGALAASVGPMVLEWAGSDYDAMLALWRRAIRYELQFPLYTGRPEWVSEKEWKRMIAAARDQNSEARMLGGFPSRAEYEAGRTANGLAVGPWINPGRPLKDDWR